MVPLLLHTHILGAWLNIIWTVAIKLVVSNLVAGFQKWVKIVDLWLAIVKQLSEEEKCLASSFVALYGKSCFYDFMAVRCIPLPFCLVVLQHCMVLPCRIHFLTHSFSKLFKYIKYYLLSLFQRKERLLLPSVSSDYSTVLQLSRSPFFSCTGGCFTEGCWWLASYWGCEDSLSCYLKK